MRDFTIKIIVPNRMRKASSKMSCLLILFFTTVCLHSVYSQQLDSLELPKEQIEELDMVVSDTVIVVAPPQGSVEVKGIVTDAATGSPLSGISFSVGQYSSTISDNKGQFVLYVPSYATTIIASGQGYQYKEVPLKGRTEISVQLHEDNFKSLYGTSTIITTPKRIAHTVNALVSVNATDNFQSFSETPENYLQGKVPGLNMIRRSGTPGIGTFMNLRGFNSLYTTNQPLVVVDGMIYDMNDYGGSLIKNYFSNPLAFLDIKDIDNITVVKDATSQFGSKGANGAIFITTTHTNDLATRIDFSASGGINFIPSYYPVLGASDYREYAADVLKSAGYSDQAIQSLPYMIDSSNPDYYVYHNNTNWQKPVFKNSYNQNYYLRVTGGDNIAKYALTIGYLDNKGIVDQTWNKRYSTRFNADLNISPRITGNANLSFIYGDNKLFEDGLAEKTNPVFLSLVKSPLIHPNVVSEDGAVSPNLSEVDIFNVGNPERIISNMMATNKSYRFFGSVNFNYKINDHLNVASLFGLTTDKVRENLFIPKKGVVADTLYNAIANNRMGAQLQRLFQTYSDTRLSFDKIYDHRHALSSKLGMRIITNKSEEEYGLGYNSATDELVTIGTGANSLRQVGGNLGMWTWINYYATVDYNFMSKYFVSFNVAMDGSSRFGDNAKEGIKLYRNSFGVFPSVGVAWLISSENFMANAKFLEVLKLRMNYGLTGNDDVGNYSYNQTYISQNFLGMQGLVQGNFANRALQWETVKKINAGLDVAVLNERLWFSIDVFRNNTGKMLTYQPIESVGGFKYMLINGGNMQNQGLELALNSRVVDGKLKVDLGLNVAAYRNELKRLPEELETQYAGATILSGIGQPLGVFYGYKTNGVFTSDEEASASGLPLRDAAGNLISFRGGDVRFEDYNNDGFIDAGDRQIIGNPNPDFTGLFTARVSWKKITMDAGVTFSKGNDIYNALRAQLESMSNLYNQTPAVVNRWRINGQETNMPRAEWGDPMGNARFSDRWIEDGSYIRLRTISLTYDIPVKSAYFKYASVYVTGNNLLTFTRYLGYDPEFSASNNPLLQGIDTGRIPQFRSVLVGIRVGL